MIYIILIGFLLIPIAIIAGLIYAYKKLPRRNFLLLLFVLVACPFILFKSYERDFMLSVVPDALYVSSVSYSKEESWGFGPGGNEAGIRTYPLPEKTANEISRRGIEFFNNMPANRNQQSREWRGKYETWYQTPIIARYGQPKEETKQLNIYNYICYRLCIDIDPRVVRESNEIINSEGSYYAYGRVGLIIISPNKKLVLYMYNG